MANYIYNEVRENWGFLDSSQKEFARNRLANELICHIKKAPMIPETDNMHEVANGIKISEQQDDFQVPKYLCVTNIDDCYMGINFTIDYSEEPNSAIYAFYATKTKTNSNWSRVQAVYQESSGTPSSCTFNICTDKPKNYNSNGDDETLLGDGPSVEKQYITLGPGEKVWIKGNNSSGLCEVDKYARAPMYWTHIDFVKLTGGRLLNVYMTGDITSLINGKGGDITVPIGRNYWFHGLFGKADDSIISNAQHYTLYDKFKPPVLSIFDINDETLYSDLFNKIAPLNSIETMQKMGNLFFTKWLKGCGPNGIIHTRNNTSFSFTNDTYDSIPAGWEIYDNLPEPKY